METVRILAEVSGAGCSAEDATIQTPHASRRRCHWQLLTSQNTHNACVNTDKLGTLLQSVVRVRRRYDTADRQHNV
jgi:hypothetical protein